MLWLTADAKFKAMHRFFLNNRQTESLFVLSGFQDTLTDFARRTLSVKIPFKSLRSLSEYKYERGIYMMSMHNFLSNPQYNILNINKLDRKIFFILLEHYPYLETDEKLLEKINNQIPNNQIDYYLAIDEPFFKQFGSDRIAGLMHRLGMKEDEMMEHKMISNSIKNAQKKVSKKISLEKRAGSINDWLRLNKVD